MKVRSLKNKGRRLQVYVAKKISEFLNIPYGKDALIEAREMDQQGVDVKLLGEAKEKFPIAIECKNTEKLNISQAIKQAKENKEKYDYKYYAIVWKKNYSKPIILMDFDEFLSLLSYYQKH